MAHRFAHTNKRPRHARGPPHAVSTSAAAFPHGHGGRAWGAICEGNMVPTSLAIPRFLD
jgi:hypothetical protein